MWVTWVPVMALTQALRPGRKHFYLRSHLASSSPRFKISLSSCRLSFSHCRGTLIRQPEICPGATATQVTGVHPGLRCS